MSDVLNPYTARKFATGPNSLYKTPSDTPGDFRPVTQPRAKTYEAVSSWQRRQLVDISRVIAAGVPTIDAALIQAGEFSIGDSWHIKSRSSNKAWGKKRDESLNQIFFKDCNARGKMNDWWSSLRQLNWTRKVEADYGIVFDGKPRKDSTGKEYDPTGKFRVIKYDRISTGLIGGWQGVGVVSVGSGLDECKELPRTWNYYSGASGWSSWPGIYIINDKSSIFDGQRIIDGIIVNENMDCIGYRIVGFNMDGLPVYVDIPKDLMHFNFSARRQVDMIRGFPELAEAIIPIMHLDDIQNLIEMAIKLASAMAIYRKSTDGRPASGVAYTMVEDTTSTVLEGVGAPPLIPSKIQAFQEIFPGIVELATNNKEELGALEFDRPSMNEEAFIARVEQALLHKLWPRSLIFDGDTKRAGTRAIGSQARTICRWDQRCTERDARWICDRRTEFEMRMGYIPYNDNLADPYNYVFTVPAEFTVDEGNDQKLRLMSLGRGTISRGQICELDGYLAEEIEEQREAEEDRLMSAAERLSTKHSWISPKEALLRLDSGDANISFAEQPEQPGKEPDGDEPKNEEKK